MKPWDSCTEGQENLGTPRNTYTVVLEWWIVNLCNLCSVHLHYVNQVLSKIANKCFCTTLRGHTVTMWYTNILEVHSDSCSLFRYNSRMHSELMYLFIWYSWNEIVATISHGIIIPVLFLCCPLLKTIYRYIWPPKFVLSKLKQLLKCADSKKHFY